MPTLSMTRGEHMIAMPVPRRCFRSSPILKNLFHRWRVSKRKLLLICPQESRILDSIFVRAMGSITRSKQCSSTMRTASFMPAVTSPWMEKCRPLCGEREMKTEPLHLNFYDLEVDSLPPEFKALANVESEDLLDEPQGFWKRRFSQEPTRKQRIFDWAYGVVIPLICVAADPIIFRTSGPYGSGLLGSARPFAYLLSAASILAMAAWLLWGERLRWLAAPMAGLFFVGGGVSLLVGLILIPFSVIGLIFFLVGLLGFTPLLSSVVFLRNGLRAYRSAAVF